MEILIFSTDVKHNDNLEKIAEELNSLNGIYKWTIDLEDREKILRVESNGLTASEIVKTMRELNYNCEELQD